MSFLLQSSSLGASFCYLLVDLVGKSLVWKYIPDRASSWAERVICYNGENYIWGGREEEECANKK